MKNVALLVALFFCYTFTSAQQSDSSVVYNQRIEWRLFKGISNNDTLGARISTFIDLEVSKVNIWNGVIFFKAYAIMNTYTSWVKPGYTDQYTLQHEQTHFNLTEICAKGLRKEVNLMKLKSTKSGIIQTIFTKWQNKLEGLQRQYDLETKGGNDSIAQKIWNEKAIVDLK